MFRNPELDSKCAATTYGLNVKKRDRELLSSLFISYLMDLIFGGIRAVQGSVRPLPNTGISSRLRHIVRGCGPQFAHCGKTTAAVGAPCIPYWLIGLSEGIQQVALSCLALSNRTGSSLFQVSVPSDRPHRSTHLKVVSPQLMINSLFVGRSGRRRAPPVSTGFSGPERFHEAKAPPVRNT